MYKFELNIKNTETQTNIEFNDTFNVSSAGNTLPVYSDTLETCKEALTDSKLIDNNKVIVKSFSSGKMIKLSNVGNCGDKDSYIKIKDLDNGKSIFLRVELKICDELEFNFKSPTKAKTVSKKSIDIGF
jgi:hypothetical protein